jgi:hypothetical protein
MSGKLVSTVEEGITEQLEAAAAAAANLAAVAHAMLFCCRLFS